MLQLFADNPGRPDIIAQKLEHLAGLLCCEAAAKVSGSVRAAGQPLAAGEMGGQKMSDRAQKHWDENGRDFLLRVFVGEKPDLCFLSELNSLAAGR